MTVALRIIVIVAGTTLVACSSLGGGGGGGSNLPNRGIVPYDRVLPEEGDAPVFAMESEDPTTQFYVEPHAIVTDEQTVILFAEARQPSTTEGSVVRCDLNDRLECDAPRTVLEPTGEGNEWLSGRAGAPSVLAQEGSWLMAFAYGQGDGIGLAWSIDGEHFTLDDDPLIAPSGAYEKDGVDSPSLIRTATGYRLYYEGRDSDGVTRVLFADGDAALTFERGGVALENGVGCEDVTGQPEPCWDAGGVGSPEVRVATTTAGRTVYRLFYTGFGADGFDLGFSASWDGVRFSRFVYNPVIATDAVERQPSNLQLADRYVLFFEERVSNTVRGIGVAINDLPAQSESF